MKLVNLLRDLKEKWTFFDIERRHSEPNNAELSEWLTDVALVHNQLNAKRSHESKTATDSWKKNKVFPKKEKPEPIQQKTRDI